MKPKEKFTEEQADILDEFRRRSKGAGLDFFAVVGDSRTGTGASVFGAVAASPPDSAPRNARRAHVAWEERHGLDPDHDRGGRKFVIRFRAADRDIFEAIVDGRKKIETRAATKKYAGIKAGDIVVLSCGGARCEKSVARVEHFPSVAAILRRHRPKDINPSIRTAAEARAMWAGFPGYTEKIRRGGLVAFHLK